MPQTRGHCTVTHGGQTPECPQCRYDLTGNTTGVCPECGWAIDWAAVRWVSPAEPFPGSPAYRPDGGVNWRGVPATFKLAILHPILAARTLRFDEPLLPAALIAGFAVVVGGSEFWLRLVPLSWHSAGVFAPLLQLRAPALTGAFVQVALQVLLFVISQRVGPGFHRRARLMMVFSLYTSIFLLTWPLLGPPFVTSGEPNLLFMLRLAGGGRDLAQAAVFWWWFVLLMGFTATRTHSVVMTVLMGVTPALSFVGGFIVGLLTVPRY